MSTLPRLDAALGTPEAIRSSEDPWVRGFLARKSGGRDALDEEFFVKLESRRIGRKKPKEANP